MEILGAAATIDPENKKVFGTISQMRTHFMMELIARLEAEIENEFPDKFQEAEKMIMANQLVKAENLVDEIFNEEPKTGQTYYIKGLALYMSGSLKESVKMFKHALELDELMERAASMLVKASKLDELSDRATAQMTGQKYHEAINTLTEALSADTDNRVMCQASLFQRALAHFNTGNFEGAFDDFKKFEMMKTIVGDDILKQIGVKEDKKVECVFDGLMTNFGGGAGKVDIDQNVQRDVKVKTEKKMQVDVKVKAEIREGAKAAIQDASNKVVPNIFNSDKEKIVLDEFIPQFIHHVDPSELHEMGTESTNVIAKPTEEIQQDAEDLETKNDDKLMQEEDFQSKREPVKIELMKGSK